MAQQEQTTASPTPPSAPPRTGQENSLGLKAFNRTGQEDTASKVLRPVGAPGSRGRNIALWLVVLVAAGTMLSFAYQRSGLSFLPAQDAGQGFGQANTNHNPDRSE